MTNEQPLVSVIVAAYNAARYLAPTLESLFGQTYASVEIIVIDDGSTDETPEILKSYADRIQILHQANQGQGIARNVGCRQSKGSLLAFIDSDDLWDSDKLEKQVGLLKRFPAAVATYCDYRIIDEEGSVTQPNSATGTPRPSGNILQQLLIGNCVGSPSVVLVRREAFFTSGGFNEQPSRASEDYGLWLALATQGAFIYNPETLVSYRRHAGQATQGSRYDFNRALGNLACYDRMAAYMVGISNSDTRAIYRFRLWKAVRTLAWAARRHGVKGVAAKACLRALRRRPWRLDIIVDLLRSL